MTAEVEYYNVAWICAISTEYVVACELLDEEYPENETPKVETHGEVYKFGRISEHKIVIGCLAKGRYGIASADALANKMQITFPNLLFSLIVGIAGGAPSNARDIRLGDVVVSSPTSTYGGGVVQYDLEKAIQGCDFRASSPTSTIPRPVLNAMSHLETLQKREGNSILKTVKDMLRENERLRPDFDRPETGDRLYYSTYVHSDQENCHCQTESETSDTPFDPLESFSCQLGLSSEYSDAPITPPIHTDELPRIMQARLVRPRSPRCVWRKTLEDWPELSQRNTSYANDNPTVHYGLTASANTLMDDAMLRDVLAQRHGVLCFGTEAAGLNDIPCVVIRGICDYSDSHKNDKWQGWAAATAAAYAKELLTVIPAKHILMTNIPTRRIPMLPVYVLPAHQNQQFVGREQKLTELEEKLYQQQDSQRCAVFGLGGIGKTQLVLQFCYMVKQKYPDRSIFWVSALSSSRFRRDCITIARRNLLLTSESEEDPVTLAQKYLSSNASGQWLLIVDDADEDSALSQDGVRDSLPQNDRGLILFITRHKKMAVELAQSNITGVEGLTTVEAEEFLKQSLGNKVLAEDRIAVKELLEELSYLPLAITQASAYILNTSITVSKYLALMRSTGKELVGLSTRDYQDPTRDQEARNAITATWLISFQRIKSEDPIAADLLFFMAVVENKSVPLSMLPEAGKIEIVHAIGVLIAYSFMTKQKRYEPLSTQDVDDEEIYDIHRSVHQSAKSWIQTNGMLDTWREKALKRLITTCPNSVWDNRDVWRSYEPHIVHLLNRTKSLDTATYADLCLKFGRCLRTEGRMQEAIQFTLETVAWRAQWLPSGDTRSNAAFNSLTESHQSLVQQQAQSQLNHRVDSHAEEGDYNVSVTHIEPRDAQTLARLQDQDPEFKKALQDMDCVTTMADPISEENPHDPLVSLQNLAKKYHFAAKSRSAAKIFEDFMKEGVAEDTHATETTVGPEMEEPPIMVYTTKSGVKMLTLMPRRPRIIQDQLLMAVLMTMTSKMKAISVTTAIPSKVSIAEIEEAINLLEDIVNDYSRILPSNHPSILQAQYSLATAHLSIGTAGGVVSILEHVVKTSKDVLPPDDGLRLASQHALALAYLQVMDCGGYYANKAIALYEEIAAKQATKLKENDPERLATRYRLAQTYIVSGQFARQAIHQYKKHVTQQSRDIKGAARPGYCQTRYYLVEAYVQNGELDEAIAVMRETVEIQHRNREPGHPDCVKAEVWLAWLCARQAEEQRQQEPKKRSESG